MVRLVDCALAKEWQIRELACDLIDLVEAGNHRVLLNFQGVERLVSWVVLAVDEAHRRCRSAPGGAPKICGLQPQLADIFPIAGMGQGIEQPCRRDSGPGERVARAAWSPCTPS